MKEEVQLLIDLQELDQHILASRKLQEKLHLEQEALALQANKFLTLIAQLDSELETAQKDRSAIKQALLQEGDNIARAESRLPEIKTQKEYLAVLKEVDIAKKQGKDLQDQLDVCDQGIATLEEDRLEKQQQLEALQQSSHSRASEICELLTEIESSLASEDEKRENLAAKVPAAIRKRYELLLTRRNGLALVEAQRCTCTGCNMHLPPQFFNAMLKRQNIDSCPHCNRLLYVMPYQG